MGFQSFVAFRELKIAFKSYFTSPNYTMRLSFLFACVTLCSAMLAQTYQSIEATEWDPGSQRWLVSNGNSVIAQDMSGTLSFLGNAQASYGMEIMNGTLFTIHSGNVKAYDATTGDILMNLSIPGTGFLNGMGSDPATNRIWVSDFGNNEIIEIDVNDLDNPTFSTVVSNTGSTPNGVVYDQIDDRLVFASWGGSATIKAVNLDTYAVSTLVTTSLANIDGIDMTDSGYFIVSSWTPTRLTVFNHDFSDDFLLSSSGLSNPADISWSEELQSIGVANSGNQTLSIVSFIPESITELESDYFQVTLFPNPVSSTSRLSFTLNESGQVDVLIRDIQGRMVQKLIQGNLPEGDQTVILESEALEEGQYFLEILTEGLRQTKSFVVIH